MPKVKIYEEANRRLDKVLGAYLALYAWRCGVDAVAVSRDSLMASFGVSKLHWTRVDQFLSDNEPLFPYSEVIAPVQRIEGVVMARKAIPKKGGWLGNSAKTAANALAKADLSTVAAPLPSEGDAVTLLAQVANGLVDFDASD